MAPSRKFTSTQMYRRRASKRPPVTLSTITTRSKCKYAKGFFDRLPVEVFELILDYLSVIDISVLSMASKALSSSVVRHAATRAWKNRMILQTFHCSRPKDEGSFLAHYRSLGLLFKRCTLLLPTRERLKFTYSQFSQTLIAGWDEVECRRVFNFMCEFTNLPRKLETVVTSKPGFFHRLELQIRVFCRGVLLDPWQTRRDARFWLTCLLKPWPMVSQARLLLLLYGPLHPDGKIGWQDVHEGVVAHCGLLDLAKAIILLHSDVDAKDWSAEAVLCVIDEIAVLPQPWHMENLARLLLLCGNSICYNVLASKAISGGLFKISRLLVFLIVVCEKDGYCMNWSAKMTQQVCQMFPTASEKWSFIQSMENMFSEVTLELYELVMSGNRNEDFDAFQSLCSLLNASAHFHTEIVYMFLKKG